MSLMTK